MQNSPLPASYGPWPGPWLALGLALGLPLAWRLPGPWPGPWLALGLALGWPLAWPVAGPWPGPWLALGLNFVASAAALGFKERLTIYLISPPHIKTVESSNRDLQFQIGFIIEFVSQMIVYDETLILDFVLSRNRF